MQQADERNRELALQPTRSPELTRQSKVKYQVLAAQFCLEPLSSSSCRGCVGALCARDQRRVSQSFLHVSETAWLTEHFCQPALGTVVKVYSEHFWHKKLQSHSGSEEQEGKCPIEDTETLTEMNKIT